MTAVKFRKTESTAVVTRGWGEENGGCLSGIDLQDQKSCGNLFHNNVNIFNTTELYI